MNIPKDAKHLIQTLHKHKHSAYIVGGCVRDTLLGRTPNDWDICTSATPDEMLEIFKNQKIIKTGLQHGTVTVVINGEPYEITTFRQDGKYSDGRHPDAVTFTSCLNEDLKRRDFTINAMAYNDKDGLIYPFGGLDDLKSYTLRCVGNPKERFEEDTLRILRAIRFSAQLNLSMDYATDLQVHLQRKNLKNISMERIRNEFCKIVASANFGKILPVYHDIFSVFIPELDKIIGFKQNNPYHKYDVFEHTVKAIQMCDSDDFITKLAIFFHDFGKPYSYQDDTDGYRHFKGHGKFSAELTDTIMKRLKFDNDTRNNVVELVYYHDATIEVGDKYVKRWLNKIGETQFRRLLGIRKADVKGQHPDYETVRLEKIQNIEECLDNVLKDNACFTLKNLAINGTDLLELGYKPGKTLGKTLNELLQLVIDGTYPNEKETLQQVALTKMQ